MLTEKAMEIAKRLAQGEVLFAHREPRLCPIIRDQLRSVGLSVVADGLQDVKFFAADLIVFRQRLAEMVGR